MSTDLAPSPLVRRPGLLARGLFLVMDVVYGRATSLEKFAALELVARVPYQAWESVAYVALTHLQTRNNFMRRVFEFVVEARHAQDNEQWHLMVLEELLATRGARRSFWTARAIPQLLAVFYYHVSWLLYVLAPRLSYALNADFEDHAERAYLAHVRANPELDAEPWHSESRTGLGPRSLGGPCLFRNAKKVGTCEFSEDPALPTVGALLRRIASDEREHRDHSLARLEAPRFAERAVA
ncbi:MAG: alternative oxidase [Polyangiaceae bacterium]